MTWALAFAWIRKHWLAVVLVGVVVWVAWLWESRSHLIERCNRLESDLALRVEQNARDRIACAEIADALAKQQKATDDWAKALEQERTEHEARMVAEARRAEQLRANLEAQKGAAIESIRRAETCEQKVDAMTQSLAEVMK